MAQESSPPVFFKNKEFVDGMRRLGNTTELTPYNVCIAVEKTLGPGTVEGAQFIRGLWRVYLKSHAARIELLIKRELRLRDVKVTLYEKNPFVTDQDNPDELREKVTFKDLPLSVSSDEMLKYMQIKNVKVATDVNYARERDPNGKLTVYKNGDRYMYCVGPVDPLPRVVFIAGIKCRIYHNAQFSDKCRACDGPGHKAGEDICPAKNTEDNVTCFRGHLFPLSNFYQCDMKALGREWKQKCIEHIYQWWRADKAGRTQLAEDIIDAEHGGRAKQLSKELPEDQSDLKERVSMMKHLIGLKADQVPIFRDTLLDSKEYIAEATSDRVWACGLSPKFAMLTKPHYWPGQNILGNIMMEVKEKLLQRQKDTSQLHESDIPLTPHVPLDVENATNTDHSQCDGDIQSGNQPATPSIPQSASAVNTPTAKPRGRPRKRNLSQGGRCSSWGGAQHNTSRTAPSVAPFLIQRSESGKRKQPFHSPPKQADSKVSRTEGEAIDAT